MPIEPCAGGNTTSKFFFKIFETRNKNLIFGSNTEIDGHKTRRCHSRFSFKGLAHRARPPTKLNSFRFSFRRQHINKRTPLFGVVTAKVSPGRVVLVAGETHEPSKFVYHLLVVRFSVHNPYDTPIRSVFLDILAITVTQSKVPRLP